LSLYIFLLIFPDLIQSGSNGNSDIFEIRNRNENSHYVLKTPDIPVSNQCFNNQDTLSLLYITNGYSLFTICRSASRAETGLKLPARQRKGWKQSITATFLSWTCSGMIMRTWHSAKLFRLQTAIFIRSYKNQVWY